MAAWAVGLPDVRRILHSSAIGVEFTLRDGRIMYCCVLGFLKMFSCVQVFFLKKVTVNIKKRRFSFHNRPLLVSQSAFCVSQSAFLVSQARFFIRKNMKPMNTI